MGTRIEGIEQRLADIDAAYRGTMARCLALETLVLALLPTVCAEDRQTAAVLDAAEAALKCALDADGADAGFTADAVSWFVRMRADALGVQAMKCH